MKKRSSINFVQVTSECLENLTSVVKETLATGYNLPKTKIFTTADLWNIQCQGKRRTQRRFSF